MTHYLQYLAVRVALCLLQSLRLETYERWAPRLAWVCYDLLKLRRKTIEENLAIAFPQLDAASQRRLGLGTWEHLFLLVAEVALVGRKIHDTNWRQYLRAVNFAPLARAMLAGRPTLILSGHLGNFELSNYVFGLFGIPTLAVARALDNPYLDRFLRTFRRRGGQRIVDKKGGFDDIQAQLASNNAVSLLADQSAGSKGCWVQFFGRPASTHKAIALLALEFEAPVIVGYTRRRGKPLHYDVVVASELDPRDGGEAAAGVTPLTQWFTTELEKIIRQMPEQYWWVHRRWKGTPPTRRKGSRAASASSTDETPMM